MKKYLHAAGFILLVVSLGFGCTASKATLRSIKDYSLKKPKPGERTFYLKKNTSLAFGRLVVSENRAARDNRYGPTHFIVGPSPDVYSKWLEMWTPSFFIWRLPPGDYQVLSMMPGSMFGTVLEPTPITFRIPDSNKAYYLGDLVIDWDVEDVKLSERITRRRCRAVNSIELRDEFDGMKNKFADNYEFPRERIEKSLMVIADPFKPEEKQLILKSASKYKTLNTRFDGPNYSADALAPLFQLIPP